MPRWYILISIPVRVVGFLVMLWSIMTMIKLEGPSPAVLIGGLLFGGALLVLPSLPKAYIEQRNRMRNGSFQGCLNTEESQNEHEHTPDEPET